MTDSHSITRDPLYYIVVGFFALLTTGLPAIMGQPRFLPFIQTLALTIFVIIPLHQNHRNGAIRVMAIWLPIQFILLTLLSRLFVTQLEHAFTDGFAFRGDITAWFFGGAPHPTGLIEQPMAFVMELAGVILGSLVSAGFVGTWFLVRLINQSAYGTGILLAALENPVQSLLVIPYWSLIRAAGYGGLVILCAQPLLTYNWSPSYYWQTQRKLILYSILLVLLGILLELFLPAIVARPPVP
jgi:hypothetical protein